MVLKCPRQKIAASLELLGIPLDSTYIITIVQ